MHDEKHLIDSQPIAGQKASSLPTGDETLIMHIDMDAFFASVEVARRPWLKGKPVCVGGPGFRRGVVSSATYEARAYGIHAGMPVFEARQKCPTAEFVPTDFRLYSHVSKKIIRILRSITSDVEPLSADEAYVGLRGLERRWKSIEHIGNYIKKEIAATCDGITCSLGIAPSRAIAKLASDYCKPDGFLVVTNVVPFLAPLEVQRIPGIGRQTWKKLSILGLTTIGQLHPLTKETLFSILGKHQGGFVYHAIRGLDSHTIHTDHEPPKSVSHTSTLHHNTADQEELQTILAGMCDALTAKLYYEDVFAKTLTLIIRYDDFTTLSRHLTFNEPLRSPRKIYPILTNFLSRTLTPKRPVRLIGMALSNFTHHQGEPTLFTYKDHDKEERILEKLHEIRRDFGKESIWWGARGIGNPTENHPNPFGAPYSARQ